MEEESEIRIYEESLSEETQYSNSQKVIRRALELLKKGWTQQEYAKQENGYRSEWPYRDAVSFCAVGALARASWELEREESCHVYTDYSVRQVNKHVPLKFGGLTEYNDNSETTANDIIEVFEACIR